MQSNFGAPEFTSVFGLTKYVIESCRSVKIKLAQYVDSCSCININKNTNFKHLKMFYQFHIAQKTKSENQLVCYPFLK